MYLIIIINGTPYTLQVAPEGEVNKLVASELKLPAGSYSVTNCKLYAANGTLLAEDDQPNAFTVGIGIPTPYEPVLVFINGNSPLRRVLMNITMNYGFIAVKSMGAPVERTITFVGLLGILESEYIHYQNDQDYSQAGIIINTIMNGKFQMQLWKNGAYINTTQYNMGVVNPLPVTFIDSGDPNDTYKFIISTLRYVKALNNIVNINDGANSLQSFTIQGGGSIPVNDEGHVFFTMYPVGRQSNAIPAHQFTYIQTDPPS